MSLTNLNTTVDKRAFSIWITGLPASGKSTLAGALMKEMRRHGIRPLVLESDELRTILTPQPAYSPEEREYFYRVMVELGKLAYDQSIPVIFDATAHRRAYREEARSKMDRFFEVYVDTPLQVCMERDPKGIYEKARKGETDSVPGFQEEYEPPIDPAVVFRTDQEEEQEAVDRILEWIRSRGRNSS